MTIFLQSGFDGYKVPNVPSETTILGFERSAGSPSDGTSSVPALRSAPMEAWRTIPGYDKRYEVSDNGNVRSCVPRGWNPTWGPSFPYTAKFPHALLYNHDTRGYPIISIARIGRRRQTTKGFRND